MYISCLGYLTYFQSVVFYHNFANFFIALFTFIYVKGQKNYRKNTKVSLNTIRQDFQNSGLSQEYDEKTLTIQEISEGLNWATENMDRVWRYVIFTDELTFMIISCCSELLTLSKGFTHASLSRDFVCFVLSSKNVEFVVKFY